MSISERCISANHYTKQCITDASSHLPLHVSVTFWRSIKQRWSRWLANTHDLKVQKRVDRDGHPYWNAYNPITRQTTSGSDREIRSWIDQQYR